MAEEGYFCKWLEMRDRGSNYFFSRLSSRSKRPKQENSGGLTIV